MDSRRLLLPGESADPLMLLVDDRRLEARRDPPPLSSDVRLSWLSLRLRDEPAPMAQARVSHTPAT